MNLGVKTDWDLHERSVGPVKGYHLALCAYRPADRPDGFVGYYKVCGSTPRDYWQEEGVLKGSSHVVTSAERALQQAEALGRHLVDCLPDRGERIRPPRNLLEFRLMRLR